MSVWKKTKLMLGLAADEEYDDAYEEEVPPEPKEPAAPLGMTQVQPRSTRKVSKTKVAATPTAKPVRPVSKPAQRPAQPRSLNRSVVRPIPAATMAKPHVVTPVSFNDAQEIGEKYRTNQPVIMNIQDLDRDLSRRLIDFASGLCFGLGGKMEKIADHIYMLTPTDVEVSAEERKRLRDQGFSDI